MAEILLKADEARSHATTVKARATDTQTDFETLRKSLLPLANDFRGKSAEAFDTRVEELQTSAKALLDSLDALGDFLNSAAETIENTDSQIAAQLNGN